MSEKLTHLHSPSVEGLVYLLYLVDLKYTEIPNLAEVETFILVSSPGFITTTFFITREI